MQVAASVLVGVRAIFLLVELLAVLEDVSAVFLAFAIGNITVKRGKTSVHLRVGKLVLTDEKDVSMERFALVTLFVTETPVKNTG